ncbi:MAG: DUF3488 and transglutaminase-like domain-containing protein [Propionibacteriaceae bacterium]|jgi:transglutaminase-like putative cysteine protease|nr:DUF3488 and transglutaminase-like domain-containing protein [Propionibacteriaceae bacterium]
MKPRELRTLALIGAWALSAVALFPISVDRGWLLLAACLVGISALLGGVVRRLGANEFITFIPALVPGVVLYFLTLGLDPWPIIEDTAYFVWYSVPPMPEHMGFRLLCALALWLLYLIEETLYVRMQLTAVTLLLMFTPFLATTIGSLYPIANWIFLPGAAACFLLLLAASASEGSFGWRLSHIARTFVTVALACVLAGIGALWGGKALPALESPFPGGGESNPTVMLADPQLELDNRLHSADVQVLSYTLDSDMQGVYLKMNSLSSLDSQGFHLSGTNLYPTSNNLDTPEPPPGSIDFQIDVQIGQFQSQWVPLPWITRVFEAPGDWRHDPANQGVTPLASTSGASTMDLAYSASGAVFYPSPDALADALAGNPLDGGVTAALPGQNPPELAYLAREITSGLPSDGLKALALRNYLQSSVFTYDLDANPGTTVSGLSEFLLNTRSGYCVHFASAMALLAREIGIPSRVAVGFTPGKKQEGTDNTWNVSSKNMHAWTELYFADFGWVAFDPTPAGAIDVVEPTATPTPSASPTESDSPSPTPSESEDETDTGGRLLDIPWQPAFQVLLGLLGALLIALGPNWLRMIQRRRRTSTRPPIATQIENAWEEYLATVTDFTGTRPTGTVRKQLAAAKALDPDPDLQADLRTLAIGVEQARFSNHEPPADLAPATLIRALPKAPRRWLPRSLYRRG